MQTPGADLYEFSTEVGHTYTLTAYSCTTPIPSDLDGNCQVNINDFAILANAWIDNGGGTGYDLNDLARLAMDWITCNRVPASECWH